MECNKCPICNDPAPQKCSACQMISYCSSTHKKQHWKIHKNYCSFFIIKEDSDRGKGFFASRDIKAGTIILDEIPAVLSTCWISPSYFPFPSCMTCGLLMTFESAKRCSKCSWPLCSKDCAQLPIHAVNECQVFVDQNIHYPPPTFVKPSDLRTLIWLIRAFGLKQKNPEQFAQILQLQSEFSIAGVNECNWDPEVELFKLVVKSKDFRTNDTELQKLVKIFRINSHATFSEDQEGNIFRSRSLGYLYVKASRMNHSCVPNCSWEVSRKPSFSIRIFTAVPVKKGEPMTINYYLKETMYGTKQRLERIRTAGFVCKCLRCRDPTEMGTYMSAIICSSCKVGTSSEIGYFLPVDPIDIKDSAVWTCNRCGKSKSASAILPPIEKIGEMISKKDKEFEENSEDDSLLSFCKNVVSKYSGKSLHPNHWVIQAATRAAFKYLTTHRGNTMNLETSQYYIKSGLYFLAIEDKVSPGLSFHRATLQRQIGNVLYNQVPELSSKGDPKALEFLEQCIELETEALKYFRLFPDYGGSEGIADILEQNTAVAVEEKKDLILQLLQFAIERR